MRSQFAACCAHYASLPVRVTPQLCATLPSLSPSRRAHAGRLLRLDERIHAHRALLDPLPRRGLGQIEVPGNLASGPVTPLARLRDLGLKLRGERAAGQPRPPPAVSRVATLGGAGRARSASQLEWSVDHLTQMLALDESNPQS